MVGTCAFRRFASLRGGDNSCSVVVKQSSGTEACRENEFVCPRGSVSPLPAARGEVEGAKRPRARGPLSDSERSSCSDGAADFGLEAQSSREAPSPRPSPRARGEGESCGTSLRAKRSNPGGLRKNLDCFVAIAPRNDKLGALSLPMRE
jgi:hypothetical protein